MLNMSECKLRLDKEYKAYIGDSDGMEEVKDEIYEVSDITLLEHDDVKVTMVNKNRKNISISLINPELTESSIISQYCAFIASN
ncbi:MAG: hypothetical protein M0P49_00725 [Bacilli bacterium]|nr:hypothetical protein [Bacilli bacterium]